MMNQYALRKNFTSFFSDQKKIVRGKLAFKTKTTHWLETQEPVIILISIHSAIHEEIEGDLKMNALISTIKSHVRGKITILLCDQAHLKTFRLKWSKDPEKAFELCLKQAHALVRRYQPYFESCQIAYWHSYICHDNNYASAVASVRNLYQTDLTFRKYVYEDAEKTYNAEREREFPSTTLFIEQSIADILEQCACLLVIAKKGYRFQFYPGNSFVSTEYVNQTLIPQDEQPAWISVFLTIEKKTIFSRVA